MSSWQCRQRRSPCAAEPLDAGAEAPQEGVEREGADKGLAVVNGPLLACSPGGYTGRRWRSVGSSSADESGAGLHGAKAVALLGAAVGGEGLAGRQAGASVVHAAISGNAMVSLASHMAPHSAGPRVDEVDAQRHQRLDDAGHCQLRRTASTERPAMPGPAI